MSSEPIFSFAAHNKKHTTDKLHIIVHNFAPEREENPEFRLDENTPNKLTVKLRITGGDYGAEIESQCGLKGIFLQNDLQGLDSFYERFGNIDTVYFFMPVPEIDFDRLERDGDSIANYKNPYENIPDKYRIKITDDIVCERCRDNFQANLRYKDRGFDLGPGGFGPKLLDE
jgi:hypothetical protein